ncbi:(2Fe-2S)-binding protein [Streptosporangium fragile]
MPHDPSAGTARVAADDTHLEPLTLALAERGWRTVTRGPADLAVAATGDGFEAFFDGEGHWFASLPELAAWAGDAARTRPPGLRPAESRVVAGALAATSAVNPYFAVSTGPGETGGPARAAEPGGSSGGRAEDPGAAGPGEPGWRPLTALHADVAGLGSMVSGVARRLGTGERRIAASLLFQGLAARFWSPVVGAVALRGVLPDLVPARVRWRPVPAGPLPLLAADPAGWEVADPGRVAGLLYRNVVDELLDPLAQAVRETTGIAAGLLWGNAASALAGTLRTIVTERPDAAPRALRLTRELLGLGVLRGTGELAEPVPGQPFFVRRSCCLHYRLPGGGTCGDCSLLAPEIRREQWARALRQAR